jgi:hypothetical protein
MLNQLTQRGTLQKRNEIRDRENEMEDGIEERWMKEIFSLVITTNTKQRKLASSIDAN